MFLFWGCRLFCELLNYYIFVVFYLNLFCFSSQLRFDGPFRSIPPMHQISLAAFEFSAIPLLLQRLFPYVYAQRFLSTRFSSKGAVLLIAATSCLINLDQGFLSPARSISTNFRACSRAESTVLGRLSQVSDRLCAILYALELAGPKS